MCDETSLGATGQTPTTETPSFVNPGAEETDATKLSAVLAFCGTASTILKNQNDILASHAAIVANHDSILVKWDKILESQALLISSNTQRISTVEELTTKQGNDIQQLLLRVSRLEANPRAPGGLESIRAHCDYLQAKREAFQYWHRVVAFPVPHLWKSNTRPLSEISKFVEEKIPNNKFDIHEFKKESQITAVLVEFTANISGRKAAAELLKLSKELKSAFGVFMKRDAPEFIRKTHNESRKLARAVISHPDLDGSHFKVYADHLFIAGKLIGHAALFFALRGKIEEVKDVISDYVLSDRAVTPNQDTPYETQTDVGLVRDLLAML